MNEQEFDKLVDERSSQIRDVVLRPEFDELDVVDQCKTLIGGMAGICHALGAMLSVLGNARLLPPDCVGHLQGGVEELENNIRKAIRAQLIMEQDARETADEGAKRHDH